MYMNMTLDEKDALLARVIEEHYSTQKHNPACVPVAHLAAKGFDVSDTNNTLWRLKEKGSIKAYEHGWGYFEVEKGGKKVFVITRKEAHDDDSGDFEAYRIEVDAKKLTQNAAENVSKSIPKEEVEFDSLNGAIAFGKKHYAFQKGRRNQLRLKLFRDLWERREVLRGGKVKRKGEPFPLGAVAARIDLVDSPQSFERNTMAKKQLDALIKNLETNIRRKQIPIRIYKAGGIKLVVGAK